MTLHLGIDIGVQGAIAIVDQSGALLGIDDMPVLQDGTKAAAGHQRALAHLDHIQEPCRPGCRRISSPRGAANFVTGYCGVAPMIAYVVTATFKTEDGDD
jgi:hypothetical protein